VAKFAAEGFRAEALAGGVEAWKQARYPMQPA